MQTKLDKYIKQKIKWEKLLAGGEEPVLNIARKDVHSGFNREAGTYVYKLQMKCPYCKEDHGIVLNESPTQPLVVCFKCIREASQ